jgi:hypothetical protein
MTQAPVKIEVITIAERAHLRITAEQRWKLSRRPRGRHNQVRWIARFATDQQARAWCRRHSLTFPPLIAPQPLMRPPVAPGPDDHFPHFDHRALAAGEDRS